MDNYLKISNKLYNLRRFTEKGQGDLFERKMYLAMQKLEDELGITQCYNCGEYAHMQDLEPVSNKDGGANLYCIYCIL